MSSLKRYDRPQIASSYRRGFAPVWLPLFLRVRLRQLSRLIEAARPMPAGVGSAIAIVFLAGFWLSGAVIGGHGNTMVAGVATGIGLQAEDVLISGQVETSEADIVAALKLDETGSLLGFDAGEARERLLALPWVKSVAIRKLYPAKLTVSLVEKRPVAVWQNKDRLVVIGRDGRVIDEFGIADLIENRFAHLPHLVGEGAAAAADQILPVAAVHPTIAARISSYVRVGERRWDLSLANGLRINLPERHFADAVERLAGLQEDRRILDRQIARIDMRLGDRIVMQLEPEAAKLRGELVSARLKAMKKADRKL